MDEVLAAEMKSCLKKNDEKGLNTLHGINVGIIDSITVGRAVGK